MPTARRTGTAAVVLAVGALIGTLALEGGGGGGVAGPPAAVAAPAPTPKPNVVVIETDDQTVEQLRFMPKTQALIGAAGTTFANNFVSFSLCCPSRTAFLTGQYAHTSGISNNAPPDGGYDKFADTGVDDGTLNIALQQAGYSTTLVGKFLNGYGRRNPAEIPPGWTDWNGLVDPSTYRYYDYTINRNGVPTKYGTTDAEYQTDVLSRIATDKITERAAQGTPFFLWLTPLGPHSGGGRDASQRPGRGQVGIPVPAPRHEGRFASEPLPPDPAFNEADLSDKPPFFQAQHPRPLGPNQVAGVTRSYRTRAETVLAVDDMVEQVVNTLAATGQLDNTYIVFTSDNGFMTGEHRIASGKVVPYEPSIRVPLLIRGPGVPAGRTVAALTANIDLAPTIQSWTGAKALRTPDGISLTGLLAGRPERSGRDLLIESGPRTTGRWFVGLRTPRYTYVEHSTGERELYDLQSDGAQLTNATANPQYAPIQAELARRLALLRSCAGASCQASPDLRLRLIDKVGYVKPGGRCIYTSPRAIVVGRDTGQVVTVAFSADGRRAAPADTQGPFDRTLKVSLRRDRDVLVRATMTLADGRARTLEQPIRRCVAPLPRAYR